MPLHFFRLPNETAWLKCFSFNCQYRMHPEISQFPSLHFYNGKLLNGDDKSIRKVPFHKTEVLGPYVFFDIVDGQELSGKNSGGSSFCNECEADAAVEILRVFNQRCFSPLFLFTENNSSTSF